MRTCRRRHGGAGTGLRSRRGAAGALLLGLLAASAMGCSSSASMVLLDPDAFGSDQGTLISIVDVRVVSQEMIRSMNESGGLARLRAERRPLRILVGELKQRTSITIFDKEIFMNRLLASLYEADVDGFYSFLRRSSGPRGSGAPGEMPDLGIGGILEERRRQESGEVSPARSLGEIEGAELVLGGEIREILHRESLEGGGELEKRTVQYTLYIDRVAGGVRIWANAYEVVKEQVTGAVYG